MVNIAKKRSRWRKYALAALVLVICLAVGYGGRAGYKRWRSGKFASQARAFLDKKDFMSAALTAQKGLRSDFDSPDCWEIMARVQEAYGRPEAISTWMKVVDLRHGSFDDVKQCVEIALRFGNPSAAAEALKKLHGDHHAEPQYQALRGKVAVAGRQWNEAIDAYSAAIKLEPQNDDFRLAYASALVNRGWIEDRTAARQILESLRAKPKYQLMALRALLGDSLANGETEIALGLARELAALPEAKFADKIILLDLLRRGDTPDFPPTLAAMEEAARGHGPETTQLLLWMVQNKRYGEAQDWTNTFAAEDWADPRVCAAAAGNLFERKDWPALQAFTARGDWLALEYFRCALLARALREQHHDLESQGPWNAAVKAASQSRGGTGALARLIVDWGWDIELGLLLRTLLKDPKEADWASRQLLPMVSKRKDTAGLWEAAGQLIESQPGNDAAVNNFAMFSLLLGKDIAHAFELSKNLYAKHPSEGDYVSTYAFALHLMGHTAEGVAALRALGREKLDKPEVALYYGVLLAASGDWVSAPHYLAMVNRPSLLPEEAKLLVAAQRQSEDAKIGPPRPL
jgi:tetratricopeptide (TPR) repeat protein